MVLGKKIPSQITATARFVDVVPFSAAAECSRFLYVCSRLPCEIGRCSDSGLAFLFLVAT